MTQTSVTEESGIERLCALAEYVCNDSELAQRWMHRPHWELNGQSPAEVATTEFGAIRVEDALNRLFYGMPV